MTEREFDRLLECAADDALPTDIAQEVTPWRRAMGNIIGGSGMCAITLNFFNLNILLPTIGVICQLLGFRALRRENRWFALCALLSALRAACVLPVVVLNATIYRGAVLSGSVGEALSYGSAGTQVLLFFCFWRALVAAKKKAGMQSSAASAAALLGWYLAVLVLTLVRENYDGFDGFLLAAAMIVCYVLILRSLSALSKEMEESGYALTPARARVSDGALVKGIVAALALGIACGYLFFGSYRMDWQMKADVGDEAAEIRAELLALGYPEAALDDLSEDDLLACHGAVRVVTQERDEAVNDGREVREVEGNSTYITTVYDVRELHFADVAVEIAGEREQWRIFHHFRWTVPTKFSGTESIQLWPTYRESEGWIAAGELTGRILYDADGTALAAPCASLAATEYEEYSIFWGEQRVNAIFAEFSLPSGGENQRGYVAYGVEQLGEERYIINSWVNYTHQQSRIQYPVMTAAEKRKAGGWNRDYPFFTVQNALQFTVLEDDSIDLWSAN